VLVPTRDRPDQIAGLLDCLDRQTLAPERFHLVLVDDGSHVPVEVGAHAFDITLLRQAPAGPAAARNRGMEACHAPLTLLMNDDARPRPGTLEAHLRRSGDDAVLGPFDFTPRALQNPFVYLLQHSSLLFDYVSMKHGERYDWRYFWTCNLSIRTDLLREVGGFDEARFQEAIVEDVELGYRLQQRGVGVVYDQTAACLHDHELRARPYFHRMVRLGVNLRRMFLKHGNGRILWQQPDFALTRDALMYMQMRTELGAPLVASGVEEVTRFERRSRDPATQPPQELERLTRLVRRLGIERFHAGILLDALGVDIPAAVARPLQKRAPPPALLWSTGDTAAADRTARSLRELGGLGAIHEVGERPPPDLGETEWVVSVQAGVEVTPGWLERMRYHGEIDPGVSMVGPVSEGAPSLQATAPGDGVRGRFEYSRSLWPGLLLVRTAALGDAGGLAALRRDGDPAARCFRAGWRNRIARDVIVRAPPGPPGPPRDHWRVALMPPEPMWERTDELCELVDYFEDPRWKTRRGNHTWNALEDRGNDAAGTSA